MIISHEVPISLLEESRNFNDYSYALVHLFELYPQYYHFYLQEKQIGRRVLLDNSIFELGKSFNHVKFAKYIDELRPDEYIIPDTLEDTIETCNSIENWLKNYNDLPGRKIAVLQGKTYKDLKECIQFIASKKSIEKIGISFDYSYYLSSTEDKPINKLNKWERFCIGRNLFIQRLEEDISLPRNKKYHLLGCSLPQELKMAGLFGFTKYMFESVDTSSPIVHGIHGIKYNSRHGLKTKNSIKLVDLIEKNISVEQLKTIYYNVKMFRQFVNKGYGT
jgi:hypothetical protein